jgi:hypothetical protein
LPLLLNTIASLRAISMVVSYLDHVLPSSLSLLAKTVLSLLLALLSPLCAMPQVNQLSSTSARAMSASVLLLQSVYQVFATLCLLVQP